MTPSLAVLATATASVLVFPFEPGPGVERGLAERAGRAAADALGPEARGPAARAAAASIDLGAQARGCDHDVFCLVEIARLLGADRALVGRIEATEDGWLELELLVLDCERAVLAGSARPRVISAPRLLDAAAATARRLLRPPDVALELRLEPPDAELRAFGEPVSVVDGRWWSGRWVVELDAPGFVAEQREWKLSPGRAQRTVRLVPDPLEPAPVPSAAEPFGVPSRRPGSGISAAAVGRMVVEEGRAPPARSRWARPLPWVVTGVGVLTAAAGVALMVDARSGYDALSTEGRYRFGSTRPAVAADAARDELRERHAMGAALGGIGAGVGLAGLAWLLLGGQGGDP